jgi:TadE-like protein
MGPPLRRRRGSRGQALVEFALVILVFMTTLMGIIEFGVAFSVRMQISFASRDAVTAASESGTEPNAADGAILNLIDKDIMAPASKYKIDHVDIFWSTASGGINNGAYERYTPGGVLFPGWGGWTNTVDLYPSTNRCAFIGGSTAGCQASPAHSGPDRIGVTIVYDYSWITPIPSLIGLSGSDMVFTQTNLATMEPIPTI